MPRNDPYKSVLRALDVLELVGTSHNGLQLKVLDRIIGPKTGTLHVLLQTLVERGYLTKLEHPIRYVLGASLDRVDQRLNRVTLARQVSPIMIEICRQSGMQVLYQQQIASHVMVLFRVQPEKHLVVEYCDWDSPAYGTAIIFQAYKTHQEQDQYWAIQPMNERALMTWGNVENLRAYLNLAAKQRLAIIDSRSDHKLRVSGPILNSAGQAIAAISAIQHCDRITQEQAKIGVQMIYRAALKLSSPQITQNLSPQPTSPSTPAEPMLAPKNHSE